MASKRKIGDESSETRTLLLDTAERLMRDQGYAAVTSRELGKAAGLSPQIVYYYFATMDDLFEALLLRSMQLYLDALEQAEGTDNPLSAIWRISCDPSHAIVMAEMLALANHRKRLRSLLSKFGGRVHAKQTAIVKASLEYKEIGMAQWPPEVLASAFQSMSRGFALGERLNIPGQKMTRDFFALQFDKIFKKSKAGSRKTLRTSRKSGQAAHKRRSS